jgi:large subunit ribosomal protein L7A
MQTEKTVRITGYRQVLRALDSGTLLSAEIAKDTDPSIREKLLAALKEANVPYKFVDSKVELGKLCGINVGAAVAGVKKA